MKIKIKDELFPDCELKGWIEIELPNPVERIKLGSLVSLDGAELASTMKQAESLALIAMERIVALELEHESGAKFKNLEELSQYSICNKLLYGVGAVILNGIPLGKN